MFGEIFKFIVGAIATAAVAGGAALIGYYVTKLIIDEFFIEKEVRKKCPEAFKVLIIEKKRKAIKCGIFDSYDEELGEMEFESEKGVSRDIYVGQEIYL